MSTGSTAPQYIFSDYLGSTGMVRDGTGAAISEVRYKAWGETRYTSGISPTTFKYIGQREEASFGLYYYGARWYDTALGRFAQADSIVPEGVQGWDRYAYVNNNPVKYNDPSGHFVLLTSMGIGVIVGALAGGAVYSANAYMSGDFNVNDFTSAMVVGAIVGMLIGTGVGAATGVASIAAIGAGAGVFGGQIGYTATSGSEYNTGDMLISSTVGGIAGGLTSVVGVAGTTTSSFVSIGINGIASSSEYALLELNIGNSVSPIKALISFLAGASVSSASEALGRQEYLNRALDYMERAKNAWTVQQYKDVMKRLSRGMLIVEGLTQTFRSGSENYIIDKLQDIDIAY